MVFEKDRLLSTTWVGLMQSVNDLNRTKTNLPQQEGILSENSLWT